MHLEFEYAFDGGGNQGFAYVFNQIYEDINLHYANEIKTKSKYHTVERLGPCQHPGGRCGISTMKIINKENNKTTVLSFWDRTMDIVQTKDLGWETLNVVHVIGGLGMFMNPEEIQETYNVKFTPFLYPLEFLSSYKYIEKYKTPYNPNNRIKKACFIGWIYDSRKQIADILNKHPLFELFGTEAEYRGENYYEKMSQYALTLSFNGNGEWCLRDVESMGLGIPTVRAEMKTPFYKGLYPGVNYIKGMKPSPNAHMTFYQHSFEDTAACYIDAVEKAINDEELLMSISKNNTEYYDKYLLPNKIAMEFFNVFDLEILK
jgi:hypothetical protein